MELVIPEMVTLKEASQRTGLPYELLRTLCLKGEIVHIRSGCKYLINLPCLVEYLNNGGKANE